jgi:hypothetical protein
LLTVSPAHVQSNQSHAARASFLLSLTIINNVVPLKVRSGPVVKLNELYYGGADGAVHAINLLPPPTEKDWPLGGRMWKHETNDEVWSPPMLTKDSVMFVGSHDGFMYVVSAKQGRSPNAIYEYKNKGMGGSLLQGASSKYHG